MDAVKREDVAHMDGAVALPRRSGELVFHHEWERRAFAMAVALCEQGHFEWDAFRQHLIREIGQLDDPRPAVSANAPSYYEHWLASLEKVIAECGLNDS